MKQESDKTRTSYYSSCAFTYLAAMVSSNLSLQHVNYPTQVVGKSCKPIPVMILGVLLGRKRYPISKYLFVLLIVVGVGIFMFKDSKSDNNYDHFIGAGELLLVLKRYLCNDFFFLMSIKFFEINRYFR
jgi:UDP-galactose transporter B1